MSDEYYQRRASRRTRLYFLAALGALLLLVAFLVIRSLFHDACTGSYDRSPRSVILSFAAAVTRGNAGAMQRCWDHDAYFEIASGCSQICLDHLAGARFQVTDLSIGEPATTSQGRANLTATVSIACAEGGETDTGEIVLDSATGGPPWKHWLIVRSTFGGTIADPWCK